LQALPGASKLILRGVFCGLWQPAKLTTNRASDGQKEVLNVAIINDTYPLSGNYSLSDTTRREAGSGVNLYTYLRGTVRRAVELHKKRSDWIKVNAGSHASLTGKVTGDAIDFVNQIEVLIDNTVPVGSMRYSVDGTTYTVSISGTTNQPQNMNSDTNPPNNRESDISVLMDGRVTRG
jgi:hypothetical protein